MFGIVLEILNFLHDQSVATETLETAIMLQGQILNGAGFLCFEGQFFLLKFLVDDFAGVGNLAFF